MAASKRRERRLWDTYAFGGFRVQPTVRGVFGDPKARLVSLVRRSKNSMRELHKGTTGLVRPKNPLGARPAVWGYADVPGVRNSPGILSKLRQSEAGAAGVFGGQPVLHQAVCLLCGAALPHGDHQRRSQGT